MSGELQEASAPALEAGGRLGRYVLRELLGAGGMGEVYLAYDLQLGRPVALKLLWAECSYPEGASGWQQRLLREARALARLSHPNVVSVYDVGTFQDRIFVAMEYVKGCTLRQWLQEKPRAWSEVVQVFQQVGRGLAAAHEVGLVHRDFSPSSVRVGEDGRVSVLGFGLARGEEGEPQGSAGYMAPEQVLGEVADAHSDQFSYCVALYEALYGRRPFAGFTLPLYVRQVLAGQVPLPPRSSPVPTWVRALVLKGLARRPEERFRSMGELLRDLAHEPVVARRRRLRVAVEVLVLLGLASWLTWRAPGHEGRQGTEQDGLTREARR